MRLNWRDLSAFSCNFAVTFGSGTNLCAIPILSNRPKSRKQNPHKSGNKLMQNCAKLCSQISCRYTFSILCQLCKSLLFIRLLRWGFSYHLGLVEFCGYFDRWSSQSLPKETSFGSHFAATGVTRSVASIYAHAPVQLRQENTNYFLKKHFYHLKIETTDTSFALYW